MVYRYSYQPPLALPERWRTAAMSPLSMTLPLRVMVTVPEVLEILKKEGEEWTYPTVATFLRRLTAKEILGVTKKGNKLCYFPLISKEQYEKNEAEGFVESKFGGSLKNFLVAFRGSDKIGKNDMKDLRAWLDELDD